MPKCPRHPSAELLKGKRWCFLDEAPPGIEHDLRSQAYQQMSHGQAASRLAYRRYLKRRGLTDDIGRKELMDAASCTTKREQHLEHSVKQLVDNAFKGFKWGQPVRSERDYRLKERVANVLTQRGR